MADTKAQTQRSGAQRQMRGRNVSTEGIAGQGCRTAVCQVYGHRTAVCQVHGHRTAVCQVYGHRTAVCQVYGHRIQNGTRHFALPLQHRTVLQADTYHMGEARYAGAQARWYP